MSYLTKTCQKCTQEKPIDAFCHNKRNNDGRAAWCRDCVATYGASYYQSNKEKINARTDRWNERNKHQVAVANAAKYKLNSKKILERNRKWAKANRDKINGRTRERMKTDMTFRLATSLRGRLSKAVKKNYKSGSAVSDCGCSMEFLKKWLEAKFKPGMTWENHSRTGWHIDHIKPLVSFDLTKREELLKACHYTNLQPLWGPENSRKKSKLNWPQ